MEENEELKEANQKLQDMIEDERMQLLAEFRESAIMQENTNLRASYREGEEAGIVKGEKNAKLETAKKMLQKGINIETIIEVTGLTQEEILS